MGKFRVALAVLMVLVRVGMRVQVRTYDGPAVTRIEVYKSSRRMYLMHHDQVLRAYDIDLGCTPQGHKAARGDGRTPEGTYIIDRRNPKSEYHLSIGVGLPERDRRRGGAGRRRQPGRRHLHPRRAAQVPQASRTGPPAASP